MIALAPTGYIKRKPWTIILFVWCWYLTISVYGHGRLLAICVGLTFWWLRRRR